MAPKGAQLPASAISDPLALGSPRAKPSLVAPRCPPPKADWSLSDCAVGLGAFRGQVRVLMPGGGPFAQARTL